MIFQGIFHRHERIAAALTLKMKNRGQKMLFDSWTDGLSDIERDKADAYRNRMIEEETLDRFDTREADAKAESERYIDLDTMEHTDGREVGPEWLCKQIIDKLGIEEFQQSVRQNRARMHRLQQHDPHEHGLEY